MHKRYQHGRRIVAVLCLVLHHFNSEDDVFHLANWKDSSIQKRMTFLFNTFTVTFYNRFYKLFKVIHSDADRIFMTESVILDVSGGGHPDVDRIRAAHRSDVETVVPFLLMTLLWIETSPSACTVKLVMWSFLLARILHGIFYMDVLPHLPQVFKTSISVLSYSIVAYVAASCVTYSV